MPYAPGLHAVPSAPGWLSAPLRAALPLAELGHAPPALSFELFLPRSEAQEASFWACLQRLEPLGPRFVSVTYGAGGSTQARTHETVERLVRESSLVPAAHLTCVGATAA